MTAHTPGPWCVIAHGGYLHISTDSPNPWPIVDVKSAQTELDDEERANARLIASAPELLGALEEVMSSDPDMPSHEATMDAAEAAIAKAKGSNTEPAPWAVEGLDDA